jgi:hypothetical protein
MSGFRTRLDYSDNRQIKQYEKTNTLLSGATTFGLPFSALTSGPDLTTTGITSSYGLVLSTFSGNGTTTIFTWYDSNMQIAESYISAITTSNSGITQNTPQVYVGNTSSALDGNSFYLDYTGVTFDLTVNYIVDLGGAYSGTIQHTYVDVLSASSLDYSARTIWVQNPEITKTDRLIIERDAQTNYVWTCIDSEGMGAWLPNSSGGTDNIWTAGTNTSSAVLSGSNSTASGQYSIVGSYNSVVSGNRSAIIGGQNITGTSNDTVYVPNLIINTGGTSSKLGINTNNPAYPIDAYGSANSRFWYSSSLGGQVVISGTTGLPRFSIISNSGSTSSAGQTSTLSFGVRAWDDITYSVYGKKGDAFIYGGIETNGVNIISNDGAASSGEDYIRFYAGQSTGTNNGTNAADIHIQGSGATRGYIGVNTNTPTKQIDVNGNGRFRNIGSDVSSNVSLYVTSDGILSLSASDERLKTNIKQIDNSLDIINKLNGVYYNWKEGDDLTHVGFIAQEVNKVIPELTYVNKNTEEKYMGVHYQNMTAVIVEAIKELYFKLNNNDFLNTQTILAEDNNIDLNYNGNHETSLGGGIRILHGKSNDNHSELIINENGDFITNNNLIPKELTIPYYTPSSSEDNYGSEGNISRDDEYLYIKTKNGWLRANLDKF